MDETVPKAQTRFFDGMRVAREHLEHLQDVALRAGELLRQAMGSGVVHGLRAFPAGPGSVRIDPGLAFDGLGRALELPAAVTVEIPASGKATLVLVHSLRGDSPYKGTPTLLHDGVVVESRPAGPPYADGAVRIAEAEAGTPEARVRQSGEWYLTPPRHGHTGAFRLDDQMRWRFDGRPVPFPFPDYDSGPLGIDPGEGKVLTHGLASRDIHVVVEAMDDKGVASTLGLGWDFWYEITSEDAVTVKRAAATTSAGGKTMLIRARVWACGSAAASGGSAGARPPLADAGDNLTVDPAKPFTLYGDRSKAFSGRSISKYIWTQLS